MKTCPVCNKPVDLMSLGKNAFVIVSPSGKWTSLVFDDAEEALNWRATFDLVKAASATTEQTDKVTGKVRLVGSKWMTRYMTTKELSEWRAKLTPTKKATSRAASSH